MECNKCYNEMAETVYKFVDNGYIPIHTCTHCSYEKRLDRVLSKMKRYTRINNHKYLYVGDSQITIEYNNGKFYLEDRDERQIQISLDTVESLLKDLEVE